MNIIEDIRSVDNSVKKIVKKRIAEFNAVKEDEFFSELCFCLLTANFNAEKSVVIQSKLKNDFLISDEKMLSIKLRELGHRYPNTRAKFIVEARKKKGKIEKIRQLSDQEARTWLVNNIKGIGMKEASHFLRNIGFKNLAIIDFHVIDLLVRYKLIKKPKTLTKKKYLSIEKVLKKIAKELNITLAELDLYLWYLETGKILK